MKGHLCTLALVMASIGHSQCIVNSMVVGDHHESAQSELQMVLQTNGTIVVSVPQTGILGWNYSKIYNNAGGNFDVERTELYQALGLVSFSDGYAYAGRIGLGLNILEATTFGRSSGGFPIFGNLDLGLLTIPSVSTFPNGDLLAVIGSATGSVLRRIGTDGNLVSTHGAAPNLRKASAFGTSYIAGIGTSSAHVLNLNGSSSSSFALDFPGTAEYAMSPSVNKFSVIDGDLKIHDVVSKTTNSYAMPTAGYTKIVDRNGSGLAVAGKVNNTVQVRFYNYAGQLTSTLTNNEGNDINISELAADNQGNVYALGSYGTGDNAGNDYDGWVWKIGPDGKAVWKQTFENDSVSSHTDSASKIVFDGNRYWIAWHTKNAQESKAHISLGYNLSVSSASSHMYSRGNLGLRITLPANADRDVDFPVSTTSPHLTVPSSVTVRAGQNTADFNIDAGFVADNTVATVNVGGVVRTITIRPVAVSSITLLGDSVFGGNVIRARIILSVAVSKTQTVSLADDNAHVFAPANLVIPGGVRVAYVDIPTEGTPDLEVFNVSATLGNSVQSHSARILPVTVKNLVVGQASFIGGTDINATFQLNGSAPEGGLNFNISSNRPNLIASKSVAVAEGVSSLPVVFQSNAVNSTTLVTLTVGNVQRVITLRTVWVIGLTSETTSLTSGQSTTLSVTIDSPAKPGGITVILRTTSDKLTCPTSVRIPEGQTSATFTVKAKTLTSPQVATVRAMFTKVKEINLNIAP